ncbi:unnamed protein product [Paramecium sonneborni]|uniref:Uncharacterized protein n=1 Tax=Paramecium sonneborni TaxID=65129 RepID=A0A8S1NYZ7_9CILI|nr:unnamed protein product [Paramecium sonneborni]
MKQSSNFLQYLNQSQQFLLLKNTPSQQIQQIAQ